MERWDERNVNRRLEDVDAIHLLSVITALTTFHSYSVCLSVILPLILSSEPDEV